MIYICLLSLIIQIHPQYKLRFPSPRPGVKNTEKIHIQDNTRFLQSSRFNHRLFSNLPLPTLTRTSYFVMHLRQSFTSAKVQAVNANRTEHPVYLYMLRRSINRRL